ESGTQAGAPVARSQIVKRDNFTVIEVDVPIDNPRLWSPEDPFIYTAAVTLRDSQGKTSDRIEQDFGLRDFTRSGKHFTLNGEKILLRGTNITLYRFFEDQNCKALPWDRQWVTRLLDEIPGRLDWNAMRICVGIAPKFWYDIADQAGLMIQNEWLYWQSHGWDDQIRAEYTDWVWADGSESEIYHADHYCLKKGGVCARAQFFENHRGIVQDNVDPGHLLQYSQRNTDHQHDFHSRLKKHPQRSA
ncbi:unnamed protein product, partial [marine sediment metagenome]